MHITEDSTSSHNEILDGEESFVVGGNHTPSRVIVPVRFLKTLEYIIY